LASMMQEAIPDIVEKIRKKDTDEVVI
jgi:hypothetical protein